jgi:hypothetical protein
MVPHPSCHALQVVAEQQNPYGFASSSLSEPLMVSSLLALPTSMCITARWRIAATHADNPLLLLWPGLQRRRRCF